MNLKIYKPKCPIYKYLLYLLVGKVYDEVLEAVGLKSLEPVDIQDAECIVLLVCLHLN